MTKPNKPAAAPAAPAIAGEPARKTSTARTVTVACKIPNGLVLQLCQGRKQTEQTLGGSRDVTVFGKVGQALTVAGPAYPNGSVPKGFKRRPDDAAGMALTYKVPADFWAEWLKQNADTDYVRSGMIFAFSDVASVEDRAQELRDVRSGFQPVNPDGDERVAKPLNANIAGVETAEGWPGGQNAAA